ncbi:hypothetical protein P2R40_24050 [Bacillus pseudomycoides]|nr:hypothetical protein [Bacillus pseudomycoides]MDF2086458.1 hypothetical protein [Bacillus pseudomycoides]
MVFLITYCLLRDKKRMDSTKNKLYFISLIFAIVFALIPTTGLNNGEFLSLGIPAENSLYNDGEIGRFNLLGFIINFFVFYWVFKLILKVWRFLVNKSGD